MNNSMIHFNDFYFQRLSAISNKSSAVSEMGDRGQNRHGPKRGGLLCPFCGQLGPRLIQCGLSQGLLPYQVASSSIQPFGHNRHEPKTVGGRAVPLLGGAATPSNTTSPGPTFTSVPSDILIHSAIWPQQTWAENWGYAPLGDGLGPHLTQRGQGQGLPPYQVAS